jgi:hypothetical protein
MPRYSGKLHELPAAITVSQFPPAEDPAPDEHCFVCLRTFGETDNPDEAPCLPHKLASCGHLVGSECIIEFLRADHAKQCPFCRTQIVYDTFPYWVTWIASTEWFAGFPEPLMFPDGEDDIYTPRRLDYADLVHRQLDLKAAISMWILLYTIPAFCSCFNPTLSFLSTLTSSWLLSRFSQSHYPELGLSPITVDTNSSFWFLMLYLPALYVACRYHLRDTGTRRRRAWCYWTIMFIFRRILVGVVGIKLILAWKMASWVTYCVVSAMLIVRCVSPLT